MKITVETRCVPEAKIGDSADVVEIYFDTEGLESLIEELSRLKEIGDHAHFMTPSWGGDELCEEKVLPINDLVHHLKLTLV